MGADQKAKEDLREETSWERQSSRDRRGAAAEGGEGRRQREGTQSFGTREMRAKGWWRGTKGRCLVLSLPAEDSSSSNSQNLLRVSRMPSLVTTVSDTAFLRPEPRTDTITMMRTMATMSMTMMMMMEPEAQKS